MVLKWFFSDNGCWFRGWFDLFVVSLGGFFGMTSVKWGMHNINWSQGRIEGVKGETLARGPDLKMGPGNHEIKGKSIGEYKRISQFWALNSQVSRARSSLAQGRPIQPIKRQNWERRGPHEQWFHGARPGSRRPWLIIVLRSKIFEKLYHRYLYL
jgi:hypothetical protein